MFLFRVVVSVVILFFSVSVIMPPAQAQTLSPMLLPATTQRLPVSEVFQPALLRGLTVYPEQPLSFDFLVDHGDDVMSVDNNEYIKTLIHYFMAGLTVPSADLWVNLSPYEHDRIIPPQLNQTAMGATLLAQDYILKQLTASLMHPDGDVGQRFWQRVYDQAFERYGTTEIPVDTFHKVWIVPQQADIYENDNTVYVVDVTLDVMLERDYMAEKSSAMNVLSQTHGNSSRTNDHANDDLSSAIMREIILPELHREVNKGKHFAPLRQVVYALVLAKWYKQQWQQSVLNHVYADHNLVAGVDVNDPHYRDQVYQQYQDVVRQGLFDFVQDDADAINGAGDQPPIVRRYFSGGFKDEGMTVNTVTSEEMMNVVTGSTSNASVNLVGVFDFANPNVTIGVGYGTIIVAVLVIMMLSRHNPIKFAKNITVSMISILANMVSITTIRGKKREQSKRERIKGTRNLFDKDGGRQHPRPQPTKDPEHAQRQLEQLQREQPPSQAINRVLNITERLASTKTVTSKSTPYVDDRSQDDNANGHDNNDQGMLAHVPVLLAVIGMLTTTTLNSNLALHPPARKGGIDLQTLSWRDQEVSSQRFSFEDALIDARAYQGITGFYPVINHITPVPNVLTRLGL